MLDGKRVLVTGGTGSLGGALVKRLLGGEIGQPEKVIVFSRDEAKQHDMRVKWLHAEATDEIAYRDYTNVLEFRIGDVRDYDSVAAALRGIHVVFHAAALKQVPSCEYAPLEAIMTNVLGASNVARAIAMAGTDVELAVAISTDKACKPVNVMGMTKALQERIFINGNLNQNRTRFMCVRYGNVISSRGSVVPLFLDQIAKGGPVTITAERMTRFLLTLDRAVDTIFAAVRTGDAGDTYIPALPAAYMVDIAKALIGERKIAIKIIGVRPGEKIDEILISEEEAFRTLQRGDHYVIRPVLPELSGERTDAPALTEEFSSRNVTLGVEDLKALLGPVIAAGTGH